MNIEDINRKILIKLYTNILKIRLVELKIEELYPLDEMKTPVHLCIGQEAISAGVCANLELSDYVFSNHRGHGHYIAKGGSLNEMIAELYCKETGCARSRGGSMHLIDTSVGFMGCSSIVAGSIPIATGSALSSVLQKKDNVSVVFFGDAASEEGVLYESMNFAKLKNLPVLFICENNFYSVFSHQSVRQANDDISMRAKAFDMPSIRVNGTDVIEVYLESKKAIDKVRSGGGPFFIECRVYRWRAHAGAEDPLKDKYRKIDELNEWMKICPLKDFEEKLLKKNIITNKEIEQITQNINKEIEEAFQFAKESPFTDKKDLKKYLYN